MRTAPGFVAASMRFTVSCLGCPAWAVQADRVGHTRPFAPQTGWAGRFRVQGEASCLAQVAYPLLRHANRCSGNAGLRPSTQLSSQGLPSNRSGLIRLAGQLDPAAHRNISLDAHVLQEFGIAGSADPANSLSHGPSFSGLRPGSILLPRADVAGFSVWWNDLHPGVRIRLPESPPTTTERLGLARSVATSGQRRLRLGCGQDVQVARDRLRQNSGCSPWGRCGLGLY